MYLRLKDIPSMFPMSLKTAISRISEIETEISEKRYPRASLIRDAKYTAVDEHVLQDYLANRKLLRGKNTRKYVPPYQAPLEPWERSNAL